MADQRLVMDKIITIDSLDLASPKFLPPTTYATVLRHDINISTLAGHQMLGMFTKFAPNAQTEWANHLPDVKPSRTPSSTSLSNPTAPTIKANGTVKRRPRSSSESPAGSPHSPIASAPQSSPKIPSPEDTFVSSPTPALIVPPISDPERLKGDLGDIKDLNEDGENEMDMGVEDEGVQDAGSRILENLRKAVDLDDDHSNDAEGHNKGNDPSDNEAQQNIEAEKFYTFNLLISTRSSLSLHTSSIPSYCLSTLASPPPIATTKAAWVILTLKPTLLRLPSLPAPILTAQPAPSGASVSNTTIQENDSSLSDRGAWGSKTSGNFSRGGSSYTNDDNAPVSFPFNGSAIDVFGDKKQPRPVQRRCGGAFVQTCGQQQRTLAHFTSNLAEGEYSLSITNLAGVNPSYFDLDSIVLAIPLSYAPRTLTNSSDSSGSSPGNSAPGSGSGSSPNPMNTAPTTQPISLVSTHRFILSILGIRLLYRR
ncbi:hypothetical protein F5051DRAFT_438944 [Lentinula edodes]|nr:hypothetical protein F5051DRAFT_438944 [Lentinula edodes]